MRTVRVFPVYGHECTWVLHRQAIRCVGSRNWNPTRWRAFLYSWGGQRRALALLEPRGCEKCPVWVDAGNCTWTSLRAVSAQLQSWISSTGMGLFLIFVLGLKRSPCEGSQWALTAMAQPVKVLAAKPYGPGSTPRAHTVEGKSQLSESHLLTATDGLGHIYAYTHTQIF